MIMDWINITPFFTFIFVLPIAIIALVKSIKQENKAITLIGIMAFIYINVRYSALFLKLMFPLLGLGSL